MTTVQQHYPVLFLTADKHQQTGVCGRATRAAQATIKYKIEEYFPLRFVLTFRFRFGEVPFI